jgi:SAM-dependent methyltransferase
MTTVTEAPHYALHHGWTHERRRLGLLEEVFDPYSRDRLETVGVGPGARCLELGAGAGSMARWLSGRVGPGGHVTATDLGVEWLADLDEANLTVHQHDLLADDFPEGGFDFIHARAVFEHLDARDHALERVVDWLAPGGWLVIEDFDRLSIEHSSSPFARAFRTVLDTLTLAGADYYWARSFPAPLARAGLEHVDGRADIPITRGATLIAELLSLTIESMAERSIEAGLISTDEIDAAFGLARGPDIMGLRTGVHGCLAPKAVRTRPVGGRRIGAA